MIKIFCISFCLMIWVACVPKEEIHSNISTTLREDSWRIDYFIDSTENKTHVFNGFGFVFGGDQIITASNDTLSVQGEWHTGDDNDLTNLIIDFGDTLNFRELNGDWDAYELEETMVKLRDLDNTGNNFLTFLRN
jgi:hypothetical protein